ncbi:MAG: DUF1177 domain-containing protein [Candidatus Heimdallarchaeota archaeon]
MTCLKQVLEIFDLLDDPQISGEHVKTYFNTNKIDKIEVKTITGLKGKTDILKIVIPGKNGKEKGGTAPTLGVVGQLGGIGARPDIIGMVSDADGAIVALASALKLGIAHSRGDILKGDVIITTHIAPDAPTLPHKPVPFMGSPVAILDVLKHIVDPRMDALLSVDATKGNRVIKVPGFAITPTVKDGWILKISDDMINIYERVTGDIVAVVPITMQDISPYGNNVYHINSIMQPWLMTKAPIVGVAITARVPVPGCGTGANYVMGLELATNFCVEVAKDFTNGICQFYNKEEFEVLKSRYGEIGSLLRKF